MPTDTGELYNPITRRTTRTSTTGSTRPTTTRAPVTVMGSTGGIQQQTDLWKRYAAETGATPQDSTQEAARGWELANWDILTGKIPYPSTPTNPNLGGTSGGSRYGGGGGGGGGAPALTQATIDAMLQALGAQGGQLQLQPYNAAAYQGQNIAPFDPSMYQQLLQQLAAAKQADLGAIQQGQTDVTGALQNNYSNAYANAPVTQSPQMQMNPALMNTVGGDTGAQAGAVQQGNQAAQGGQAAFQNLLAVLAAADQSSQNSRMNQVAMDANYARQNVGAQSTALQGTIGMAQNQAQQAWATADEARRYQDAVQAQTWAREQAMNNTQLANTAATSNWQQQQTNLQARLQPILDMISQSNGVSGLNLSGIQQLLAGYR